MHRPHAIPYRLCSLLLSVILIAACGGAESASRSQSLPSSSPAPATLACKDCVDAGILQANIFAGPDLNALACREPWGTKVQILDTGAKEGVAIYQVKTPSCTGWVSSRLVQR